MSQNSHLQDMGEFVKAFGNFNKLLDTNNVVIKDEENRCRLFDIWLANYKDEKVLQQQLRKEPWEDPDKPSWE